MRLQKDDFVLVASTQHVSLSNEDSVSFAKRAMRAIQKGQLSKDHIVFKTNTGPRDQILPVSINWPTNYNFASFSKLPTNHTKISEKINFTYQNAPLRGAFAWVFCIFSEIFV